MSRADAIAAGQQAWAEEVKDNLVGLGQTMGDLALEGKIDGMVVVSCGKDGWLDVRFIGMDPPKALGLIQLGANLVLRQVMPMQVKFFPKDQDPGDQ